MSTTTEPDFVRNRCEPFIQRANPHGMYVIVGDTEPAYVRFRRLANDPECAEAYLISYMGIKVSYEGNVLTIDFTALPQAGLTFWASRTKHVRVDGKILRLLLNRRNNWEMKG